MLYLYQTLPAERSALRSTAPLSLAILPQVFSQIHFAAEWNPCPGRKDENWLRDDCPRTASFTT